MIRKIIVCGAVGNTEMRYTQDGTAVLTVGIATKLYKEEDTTWVEAELWGTRAEGLNNHIDRAKKVFAEGDLALEVFTRRNGDPGCRLVIKRADVQIIEWKPDEDQPARHSASVAQKRSQPAKTPASSVPMPTRNQPMPVEEADEIPF
jgi:single stranded DNA-binding protein